MHECALNTNVHRKDVETLLLDIATHKNEKVKTFLIDIPTLQNTLDQQTKVGYLSIPTTKVLTVYDMNNEPTDFKPVRDFTTPLEAAILSKNYLITSLFIEKIDDNDLKVIRSCQELDRFIFKHVTDEEEVTKFTKILLKNPVFKKRINTIFENATNSMNQPAFSHIATQYDLPYQIVEKARTKVWQNLESNAKKNSKDGIIITYLNRVDSYIFRKKVISTVKQGACITILGGLTVCAYLANSNCSGKPWSADQQISYFSSSEQSYEECMNTSLGLPDGTIEYFLSK
ncbi:MAG: hypothetical protein S4CHLAM7_07740 [Chlamydiae bacterium]|nr:hypothetical protein [Chlamydiota bacterium]